MLTFNRRDFLFKAMLGTAAVAVHGQKSDAAERSVLAENAALCSFVKALVRRDETTRWLGQGGNGDSLNMTWGSDGSQLVAVCDGLGWSKNSSQTFNSRLWYLQGEPDNAALHDMTGYPDLIYPDTNEKSAKFPRYYGFSVLAVDKHIYQYLSFFGNKPVEHWAGSKLIFSPDNGRTWCNQNGSTPVLWEPEELRSHQNMVFIDEPQHAFSVLTFLQMGPGYRQNQDGYVYVYAANVQTAAAGGDTGPENKLALFRVPKDRILVRESYEFFVELGSNGVPKWSSHLEDHGAVIAFPKACCGSDAPSVVYLPHQRCYLMANSGTGVGAEGKWFSKPSYLGFWTSPTPWGPWTQIHEEESWTPCGDQNARCYSPKIAPKWTSQDGKSFVLVWSDFQRSQGSLDEMLQMANGLNKKRTLSESHRMKASSLFRRALPHYRFNFQRVDIIV